MQQDTLTDSRQEPIKTLSVLIEQYGKMSVADLWVHFEDHREIALQIAKDTPGNKEQIQRETRLLGLLLVELIHIRPDVSEERRTAAQEHLTWLRSFMDQHDPKLPAVKG